MGAPRRQMAWTIGVALLALVLLFPFYWMLVIGVLLISVVMLGRGGILGSASHAWKSLRARGKTS